MSGINNFVRKIRGKPDLNKYVMKKESAAKKKSCFFEIGNGNGPVETIREIRKKNQRNRIISGNLKS